jgi:hypothetical protein
MRRDYLVLLVICVVIVAVWAIYGMVP